MLLASGQERVEGADLLRQSRRLVFPQYFPNSLPMYPWHWAVWVSVVPPMVLVALAVLALPTLLQAQAGLALPTLLQAQAGLEAQEVDSSKYDRGRRDSGLVHLTRS